MNYDDPQPGTSSAPDFDDVTDTQLTELMEDTDDFEDELVETQILEENNVEQEQDFEEGDANAEDDPPFPRIEDIHDEVVNMEQRTGTVSKQQRLLQLPLARVRNIMKMDPDCKMISSDAAVLVTKAAELFISYLSKEVSKNITARSKRKTLTRRDVDVTIESIAPLCFLDGMLE